MTRTDVPEASAPTLAAEPEGTSPTLLAPSRSEAAVRAGGAARAGMDPRYSLGELLGRGGMGEVLLAHDERVGRDVAIKRLRSDGDPPVEAVARFLREARVQGRLDHPAIVPVHDLGTDDGGVPYFAMKRLAGITLATILDRLARGDADAQARWPRRLLLARLAEICLAVHFAHTRGVVHRDLKPHNVMLGDFGEVYVLDWGIAKLADDEVEPTSSATIRRTDLDTLDSVSGETAAGAVLGTPGYMPPEQLRGGAIDLRVDVFALGCLLFEVLALEAALPRGAAAFDAPADALRPAARRPDLEIPPELDDAVATATAPAARDRFASARELHDAIQRYLDGDRDLARRRELAAEHAVAAERALDAGEDTRAAAMREAGRALALDPSNSIAQAVVGRILLEPPRQIPPEVEASIAAERARAGSVHLRLGAFVYLSYLLLVPSLAIWVNVRDWTVPVVTLALAIVSAGITFVASSRREIGSLLYPALALDAALVGAVGVMMSPLLLLPTLAVVSATTFMGQPMSRNPVAIIGFGFAAVLTPLVLEWTGVLPRTYGFVDGALVIRPWVIGMHETGTMVILVSVSLITILAGGSMVVHLRRAQEESQRRVHLLAWHMKQLIPDRETPPAAAAQAISTAKPRGRH